MGGRRGRGGGAGAEVAAAMVRHGGGIVREWGWLVDKGLEAGSGSVYKYCCSIVYKQQYLLEKATYFNL